MTIIKIFNHMRLINSISVTLLCFPLKVKISEIYDVCRKQSLAESARYVWPVPDNNIVTMITSRSKSKVESCYYSNITFPMWYSELNPRLSFIRPSCTYTFSLMKTIRTIRKRHKLRLIHRWIYFHLCGLLSDNE